jgi:hypothetical protein
MNKILAITCLALISLTFVSCSNDEDVTTQSNKLNVSANAPHETGGGSNGQTPIPPPRP